MDGIQVEIKNYNSHYQTDRSLILKLERADFLVNKETPLDGLQPDQRKLREMYVLSSVVVKKFKIYEVPFWEEQHHDPKSEFENKGPRNVFLSTTFVANKFDCIEPNHPLYTDTKLHVWIPTLKVTIDDGLVLLSEVIQIITQLQTEFMNYKAEVTAHKYSDYFQMGANQGKQPVIFQHQINALLYFLLGHSGWGHQMNHWNFRFSIVP